MAKVQDKNISFIINQFIDKGIRDSEQFYQLYHIW